jgi:hypothetical protein
MLRTLALFAVFPFGTIVFAAALPPVAATAVRYELPQPTLETAAAEIRNQTGIAVALPAAFGNAKVAAKASAPFWNLMEDLASQSGCRLQMQGGQLRMVPAEAGVPNAPSSIDGPFRTAVRHVSAKRDFQTGATTTEIHLDLMWEPRFPVYLIDAEPKLTKAEGEKGSYTGDPPSGRVSASGYVHPTTVRLNGIPRAEKSLSSLSGSFTVVAAEKMLAVEFKDLTGEKPIEKVVEGVKLVLKPVKSQNGQLEIGFDLEYPESHPEFESFQVWAATNKLRVFDAAGNAVKETDYNTAENGRRISANYFLPAPKGPLNLKGWRLVYETPSPMVEQKVRFDLKDVMLP